MIKFSEMKYVRPDLDECIKTLTEQTARLQSAATFDEADAAFLAVQEFTSHKETMDSIASIRHNVDTRDEFYDNEAQVRAKEGPILYEYKNKWDVALLESPFRKQFEEKYGKVSFLNLELAAKSFSPAIVEDLQEESKLCMEYTKLIASAQIPFEGGVYTLSQLGVFKQNPDDAIRRAAWVAEGKWYTENGEKLDEIYDKLTALRTKMG